jgi:hypothetical protein
VALYIAVFAEEDAGGSGLRMTIALGGDQCATPPARRNSNDRLRQQDGLVSGRPNMINIFSRPLLAVYTAIYS